MRMRKGRASSSRPMFNAASSSDARSEIDDHWLSRAIESSQSKANPSSLWSRNSANCERLCACSATTSGNKRERATRKWFSVTSRDFNNSAVGIVMLPNVDAQRPLELTVRHFAHLCHNVRTCFECLSTSYRCSTHCYGNARCRLEYYHSRFACSQGTHQTSERVQPFRRLHCRT